ncbi:MAG: MCP four helix bundle domain-containing protein, partial [Azoarcus sp.]|nr:MCP four helix bundle domain-containing protein [Azoarcus sp.]
MGHTKLKTLLAAGFAAMLVLLLIVGSVAIITLHHLSDDLEDLANRRIPLLNGYSELYIHTMGIRASTLQLFSLRNVGAQTTATLDDLVRQREEQWKYLDEIFNTISSLPIYSETTRNRYAELKSALEDWRAHYAKLDANLKRLAAASRDNNVAAYDQAQDELDKLYADVVQMSARLVSSIDNARDIQVTNAQNAASAAVKHAHSSINMGIWLMIAGAIISILVGLGIYRSVMKQVGGEPSYANDVLRAVASGDLTVQVA